MPFAGWFCVDSPLTVTGPLGFRKNSADTSSDRACWVAVPGLLSGSWDAHSFQQALPAAGAGAWPATVVQLGQKMWVADAPAPMILRLLPLMQTASVHVPASSLMVSPGLARSTAAWIELYVCTTI